MARELWVVNASPLITLAKVGRLALLERDDRELLVPHAVAEEVRAGPPEDPARLALESGFAGESAPTAVDPEVVEWGLGAGESSVLTAARARHGLAILDDERARAAARTLGLGVLGTLGVVLLARRQGRIESASEALRALREVGLHLDDALVSDALARTVGEPWKP